MRDRREASMLNRVDGTHTSEGEREEGLHNSCTNQQHGDVDKVLEVAPPCARKRSRAHQAEVSIPSPPLPAATRYISCLYSFPRPLPPFPLPAPVSSFPLAASSPIFSFYRLSLPLLSLLLSRLLFTALSLRISGCMNCASLPIRCAPTDS